MSAGVEVHLACGDTVTVPTAPAIGAYRMCEHCDARRRVVAIATPAPSATPARARCGYMLAGEDVPCSMTILLEGSTWRHAYGAVDGHHAAESDRLMDALGEDDATTASNYDARSRACDAYVAGYRAGESDCGACGDCDECDGLTLIAGVLYDADGYEVDETSDGYGNAYSARYDAYSDADGYDRNGAFDGLGHVYSDADPGL